MFSLKMVSGSRDGLNHPNSLLISASMAKAFWGNEDPLKGRKSWTTCCDLCRAGDNYQFTGFVRTGILRSGAAHQGDWHPKSSGCVGFKFMENALQRFYGIGFNLLRNSESAGLLLSIRVASKIFLPDGYLNLDFRDHRNWCNTLNRLHGKLSGYKGSPYESSEEFEV
jgi:hypothetical protein